MDEINIKVIKTEGGYVAQVIEEPSIISEGMTVKDCLINIDDAMRVLSEDSQKIFSFRSPL